MLAGPEQKVQSRRRGKEEQYHSTKRGHFSREQRKETTPLMVIVFFSPHCVSESRESSRCASAHCNSTPLLGLSEQFLRAECDFQSTTDWQSQKRLLWAQSGLLAWSLSGVSAAGNSPNNSLPLSRNSLAPHHMQVDHWATCTWVKSFGQVGQSFRACESEIDLGTYWQHFHGQASLCSALKNWQSVSKGKSGIMGRDS